MKERMRGEIRKPVEGVDTLSAEYTGKSVLRILAELERMRVAGTTDEELRRRLFMGVRSFDRRSLDRIFRMFLREPIPDDFPPEKIASVERPKESTVTIRVHLPMPLIGRDSLVRFQGKDYLVTRHNDDRYFLKEVH
jgi:hypothetical protein